MSNDLMLCIVLQRLQDHHGDSLPCEEGLRAAFETENLNSTSARYTIERRIGIADVSGVVADCAVHFGTCGGAREGMKLIKIKTCVHLTGRLKI